MSGQEGQGNDQVTAGDAAKLARGAEGVGRIAAGDIDPTAIADAIQAVEPAKKVVKQGIKVQLGCCAGLFFLTIFVGIFIINLLNPSSSSDQASASTVSGTTSGETTASLSSSIINQIKNNKPAYVAAANKEHVPWQALAAVHFREGSNAPSRSGPSGEAPGTVNPDSHRVECQTFAECEMVRASKLKSLGYMAYRVKISDSSTDEDLKKAFLAYNRGNMYNNGHCTVDQSPYVMNNYDLLHKLMRWPDNSCEPSSTRGKINVPNGAYTVYVLLIQMGI